MKLHYSIFLILMVTSFVSCYLEGIDLYREERREFRQEVDRLFDIHYFHRILNQAPGKKEVSEEDLKAHHAGDQSEPIPAYDWSVSDSKESDFSDFEEYGPSTPFETTPSPRTVEGSGGNWVDEADDEDAGSGMEEGSTEFSTDHKILTSTDSYWLASDPKNLKCGMRLRQEAHLCTGLALNIRTFFNEIQILLKILLQMKPNYLILNYSFFMPIFKVCAINLNTPSYCVENTRSNKEFINKFIKKMTEFAGERDSDLVQASSRNENLKCLGANIFDIEKCIFSLVTNSQLDQVIEVLLLSTGNWTHELCKHFQVVKICVLDSISRCNDDITIQLITIMTKADVLTTCQTENMTTTTMPNNDLVLEAPQATVNRATVKASLGTLVTLLISVFMKRL